MSQVGRDIQPFEPVTCEVLIEQIRSFSTTSSTGGPTHQVLPHLDSLSGALREAAITLRYNARWFAQPELAELLDAALEAAAASSASNDIYSAVTLIETVGTYSALPPQSLLTVARFLAQAYYNASRANKTRKLAEAVWAVTASVLKSHLGAQLLIALVQLIGDSDVASLEAKAEYACVAGAVMIVTEKLLVGGAAENDLPKPQTVEVLDGLQRAATNGSDHIRELVMESISVLLAHHVTTQVFTTQLSWPNFLAAAQSSVMGTPQSSHTRALVEGILSRLDELDPADYTSIASLCVAIAMPLNPTLTDALLSRYANFLPIRDWDEGFEQLLKRLSQSDLYIDELQMLLCRSLANFSKNPDQHVLFDYANKLLSIIQMEDASERARSILVRELGRAFTHSIMSGSSLDELIAIFDVLCELAKTCTEAAKFIMQVRADTEGTTYYPVDNIPHDISGIPLKKFDATILSIMRDSKDWDLYSHVISELPSLLGNHTLFDSHTDLIQQLREVVCHQLETEDYQLPPNLGKTKSHITAHLVDILCVIVSYHQQLTKGETQSAISIFLSTAGSRDHIATIPCIHALTICCYELPDTASRYMDAIIDKMSRLVTQKNLTLHVLIFLAGLSRLPNVFQNEFRVQDYKRIFGMCGSYLQSIRGPNGYTTRDGQSSNDGAFDALPRYVYELTHHVIAFWYLAISPEHRRELKEYITSCMRYTDANGQSALEDQGLVTVDLMDSIDADQNHSTEQDYLFTFDPAAGRIISRHQLTGLLLITTETSLKTRESIVTVRRPTGNAKRYLSVAGDTHNLDAVITADKEDADVMPVWPLDPTGDMYGRVYKPSPLTLGPIGSGTITELPKDYPRLISRIESIDRTPGMDSHKAGVIYIGEGQRKEVEILRNVQGSPDYVTFISSLGALRPLKGATFNHQGLDIYTDADGPHAVVWNNEVTELVFHITTLMPNKDDVSQNTISKKRHVGNNWVNVVFNNSGASFSPSTFPSDFMAVYIVITPSARTSFLQTRRNDGQHTATAFYRVQVLTGSGYPAISSAVTEKVVSAASLPGYVRNLALNDCVFSSMWASLKKEGDEYTSSWRSRLNQIRRLGVS